MKSKFSEIVSKYLFTYGSVGIPGIGTFSISDSSSGFALKDHVLTPPTKMVDFSEEVTDEDGLVKYLKNNHAYSRKDAEKKISDYSKKFLNDLLNYGVANIPGIGKLNKYANGEFVFEPAKEYLITSNYMLPEIKLTPIDNTAIVRELTPKPKPSPINPIPTAATTAAFLGAKELTTKADPIKPVVETKPAATTTKPAAATIKEEVKTPVVPKKKSEPLVKKPVVKKEPVVSSPIKKEPTPIVYEDEPSFWKEWKWPILILLGLIGLSIFGIKCAKDLFSGDSSIGEKFTEAKQKITGDKAGEAVIDDYLKDKPNLQKYAKYLTKDIVDEGCVIIVGTFTKARNVIKMKDKLARAGLSPYTESHNGMTRVGVLFPCQEHDLEGYIDTLRRSFDNNAWYLKPQMVVAKK